MLKKLTACLLVLVMILSAVPSLATGETLTFGMTGPAVLEAQKKLQTINYYTNVLDGIFGNGVLNAVKKFQKDNGMPVTGQIDVFTMNALDAAVAYAVTHPGNRTMEYGMSGEDVLAVQERLQYFDFYTGPLDGVFSMEVRTAVTDFQRANSLAADGKVGPATLNALNNDNSYGKNDPVVGGTLQNGSIGEAVKELQRKLREAYYYSGTIDGIYGSGVDAAVRAFQASAGLTVDGKAGKATQDALYNKTADIFNGGIPRRSLSQGDRGYDVYVLQMRLAELNYLVYATAGYYDGNTADAVRMFQYANGLTTDGKAGSVVRRYLWPSTVNQQEEDENASQGTIDDPYQERTLKQGMHGTDVANMQMRLKAGGYLLGNADGVFGPLTKAAVIALQKDYNLKQDGIVGPQTWYFIKQLNVANAEPTVVDPTKPSVGAYTGKLRIGSKGPEVKKLQQQLIALGCLAAGEDDGIFGKKTAEAVKLFQYQQHITVDGVAGPITYSRINEALQIQYEVPVG